MAVSSVAGAKAVWSPLETHLKLLNFVWAEPPKADVLATLLPARTDSQGQDDTHGARLWACGSPGLLVASLNVSNGNLQRYPLPDPTLPPRYFLSPNKKSSHSPRDGKSLMSHLNETKAVSMACVGGTQLWVGAESGTLHVFNVPDFSTHHVAQLPDAVLCLADGELEESLVDSSAVGDAYRVHSTSGGAALQLTKSPSSDESVGVPKTGTSYVLAGLANGSLARFSTKAHSDLADPFQEPPEVRSLGSSPVKAIVVAGHGVAWCGVGTEIVILQVDTLKEVTRFDAQPDKVYSSSRRSLVSHLINSSLGIWSACWHTNSIQLWDTETFSRRTSILSQAHEEHAHWVQTSADVSALAVTQGVLAIGTEGGTLLLFDIVPSGKLASGCTFRPRFIGSKNICSGLIHCIVPLESNLVNFQPWGLESDSTGTSSTDTPVRIMTCCDARPDQRRSESSAASQSAKSIRSRFRSNSNKTEDKEAKIVDISCWQISSPQDKERHQRLRLFNQAMDTRNHEPFRFPKLSLVRVCPTAVVTTPLDG